LELLHVDLFGPIPEASLGGKKYCLVIVDDYSRYCWVYFFKKKSETQQRVIDFITLVERQHNCQIMAIRSDNGSEYKNYTVEGFLTKEGIAHQYSTPYSPQQNGVAERKNRPLMDADRTMIVEFSSPYNFWAEAVYTACHATNRLYLRKNLNKTPYEILTGKKPDISYFKVFCCKCFIRKKGNRLSKFEPRSYKGIFVGYSTNAHTYRVYNKSTGQVEEAIDVNFDEDNGSQGGRIDYGVVGGEIPPIVIRRMGIGEIIPAKEHLLTEGEGL
jgi:transposase InsO family protein